MKTLLITASLLGALWLPGTASAQAPARSPATATAFETLSHGNFKNVALYRPQGEAKSFVLFLSGDRHHTELNRQERHGAYPLYDFT